MAAYTANIDIYIEDRDGGATAPIHARHVARRPRVEKDRNVMRRLSRPVSAAPNRHGTLPASASPWRAARDASMLAAFESVASRHASAG